MALVNTGGSRNQSITIETKTNGVVTSTIKYWITQDTSELSFRYGGSPVTEEELQTMAEGAVGSAGTYLDMLDDFKTAVEALYTGLDIDAEQTNSPEDATNPSCPVTL